MNIEEKIKTFAKEFYSTLDFAHNEEHGMRVVNNALYLHKNEGGNRFLIEMGAWLHQFHDNLTELKAFLNTIEIGDKEKEELFKIVKYCRPLIINDDVSLEAKIVFDADAMEVLGPYGAIREVLCNFHHREKDWDTSINDTIEVANLFKDKLKTESAINLMKQQNVVMENFWLIYNSTRKQEF